MDRHGIEYGLASNLKRIHELNAGLHIRNCPEGSNLVRPATVFAQWRRFGSTGARYSCQNGVSDWSVWVCEAVSRLVPFHIITILTVGVMCIHS